MSFLPFLRGFHCVALTPIPLVSRVQGKGEQLVLARRGPGPGLEWVGKRQPETGADSVGVPSFGPCQHTWVQPWTRHRGLLLPPPILVPFLVLVKTTH